MAHSWFVLLAGSHSGPGHSTPAYLTSPSDSYSLLASTATTSVISQYRHLYPFCATKPTLGVINFVTRPNSQHMKHKCGFFNFIQESVARIFKHTMSVRQSVSQYNPLSLSVSSKPTSLTLNHKNNIICIKM